MRVAVELRHCVGVALGLLLRVGEALRVGEVETLPQRDTVREVVKEVDTVAVVEGEVLMDMQPLAVKVEEGDRLGLLEALGDAESVAVAQALAEALAQREGVGVTDMLRHELGVRLGVGVSVRGAESVGVAEVLGEGQGQGEGEEECVLLAVVQVVGEALAVPAALPVREALEQALREGDAVGVSVLEGQGVEVGKCGEGEGVAVPTPPWPPVIEGHGETLG